MALADNWYTFIAINGGEAGARDVFEHVMDELLRAENPGKEVHLVKASQGDGGIDIYVHQENGIDVYQCKFFMGSMNSSRWTQIKNSFNRAVEFFDSDEARGVKMLRWCLCMPREMQKEDISKWDLFCKDRESNKIPISYIDGNEILQRMKKCDRLNNSNFISQYFAVPESGREGLKNIPKCLTAIPIANPQLALIGRESLLQQIFIMLEGKNSLVAVSGIGGIGKTAIMRWVCNVEKERGKYVAWIECGNSLKDDLLGLSAALGLIYENEDITYHKIISVLKTQMAGELYLFFDNLDRRPDIDELNVLNSLNAHVMVTTRHTIDSIPTINLDVLSTEDALTMFFRYYNGDTDRCYAETAQEIVTSVGRHTLLVELLARAAAKARGNLEDFAKDLAEKGAFDVFKRKLAVAHDRNKNRTIEDCVMKLYEISSLSKEQQRIMKLFSIFTPGKEIYWKVVEWAGLDLDAVDELASLAWLGRAGQENNYTIHQIIKDSITIQLKNRGEVLKIEEYGDLLAKATDTYKYMPLYLEYTKVRERLTFVEDIAKHLAERTAEMQIMGSIPEKEQEFLKSTSALYNNVAGVFHARGNYARALEYYGKALAIRERVLGPEHPDTAATYNNLAEVFHAKGDYARAMEYYRKALSIRTRVLGPEHPDTVTTYNNMAGVFRAQGNYANALEYYSKALSIRERVLGPENLDTVTTYNNMAGVYEDQGDYEKSLEYYGKALAIRERVLGTEHPDTAATYNNTASVYEDQGDYEKSLEYYGKALAIRERVLGTEHPDTATTYNNMARVFQAQGDYARALEYYGKALAIRERVLGTEHPSTATTYNNMAGVYGYQGDYAQALEYYLKALAIRKRLLGDEHPDTATTYNNVAFVYSEQGYYDKALEYYEKAIKIHEHVLGNNHPSTATTYNNIAVVYNNLSDYNKALVYLGKALSIRERVLGTNHPDTATTYNNMALVYFFKGDYDKAREYYEKALMIREMALGGDHPETAMAYNNMADLFREQGDYAKALMVYGKALDICERVAGPNHLYTARIIINIGTVLYTLGEYMEALEHYREGVVILERVLGTKHPTALETYNHIALTYFEMGDYGNAEEYYLRAISGYEIEPVIASRGYASTLRNIAELYYIEREYDRAISYYEQALNIFEKLPEKNDIENSIINKKIAQIFTDIGDIEKASEYQGRAQNNTKDYQGGGIDLTICQRELLAILKIAKSDKYSKLFLLNLLGEDESKYEDVLLKLSLEGWITEENGSIYPQPLLLSETEFSDEFRLKEDNTFYQKLLHNYLTLPYDQLTSYSESVLSIILDILPAEESEEKFVASVLCNMISDDQFWYKYSDCCAACLYVDSSNNRREYGFYDIDRDKVRSIFTCQIKSEENGINLIRVFYKKQFTLDLLKFDQENRIFEIPDRLCYNNKCLTKIVLPEKVRRIGEKSFWGCTGLNCVLELPSGLKRIETEAFFGCCNLRGDIRLPEGLVEIGSRAFAGCCNLSGALYLSDSIKKIGEDAFYYHYQQDHYVEENTAVIETALDKADSAAKIYFSDDTTEIPNNAFMECTGLYGELQLKDGIVSIGDWAFKGCKNISGNLCFPESLERIGNNAFTDCSGLTGKIRFPENLMYIGENAFKGCSNLMGEITLPDRLEVINDAVFSGCYGLSGKLVFSESLIRIGNNAFMDCTGLKGNITFPKTMSMIGNQAFKNCQSLSGKLTLSESMVFIGDEAFAGCSGLSGELCLPDSILSVGREAFAGCSGLKTDALKLKSYESREYVRSFLDNGEPLNECKVVFLGDGGAGKSMIIDRLRKYGEINPDFNGESTPGIQIFHNIETIGLNRFQIHYWDFGGQEIFHSMHRMFMTKRTLYVIVVNARGNMQDESANYWLHDVSIYAPESPVLLVINQIDQNPAASINEKRLRDMYPQLLLTVKISARDFDKRKFTDDFITKLHESIKKVPGVYALFPIKWRSLFKDVRSENTTFMHRERFTELCRKNMISEYEDIQQILIQKMQDLGVGFLYRKTDYSEDAMLLNPSWLLNAIYIILLNGSKFANNGVLPHQIIESMLLNPDCDNEDIRRVIKDEKYEKDDVQYILSVIRKFRLSYKIKDDADFFPMICDRNENSSSWEKDDKNTLHMILRYKYKPLDVFHRLIVEMHKDLDMESVWYSGALMKNDNDKVSAFINVIGNDLHLRVKCTSDNKNANHYLLIIHDQLSAINASLNVISEKLVVYQKDGKEAEFYFDDLKGSEETGIDYIYSRVHESKICIKDILYYSDSNLREYHQKLLATLIEALEKLQNNYVFYWRLEDDRNTYIRDLLEMRRYICKDQSRGGLSGTKIRDGERDIVILDDKRRWSTIYEALNLRSFDKAAQEEVDNHISKLLENYNPIGFPILYLVVYAEWAPEKFEENKQKYFEYVKSNSNGHFVVKNSNNMEHGEGQYLYHAKIMYDCGGIPFTIHHIVVRIGDFDNDNLMNLVYELAKDKGHITRKEVEEACGINATKARTIIKRLCHEEQLIKQGAGQQTTYIFTGHRG